MFLLLLLFFVNSVTFTHYCRKQCGKKGSYLKKKIHSKSTFYAKNAADCPDFWSDKFQYTFHVTEHIVLSVRVKSATTAPTMVSLHFELGHRGNTFCSRFEENKKNNPVTEQTFIFFIFLIFKTLHGESRDSPHVLLLSQ